jgi:predicted AAA+ superfamily ATPase
MGVDIVLESPSGDLVGVEVKTSATVGTGDFKGLRALAEETGKRFRRGVVLYQGCETVPFGKNLHAIPIQTVWQS